MSFFCHCLEVKYVQTAGIIIEYNPMHGGHAHLLEEVRARLGAETALVGVMSGNFVQRGDFAVLRKHARAKAAVLSGLDLVLELPLPWAVSSAEAFARGGVQVLEAAGVVTHLAFGSECGEIDPLMEIAGCLLSAEFSQSLRGELRRGDSYAACRERAVESLLGRKRAALLKRPNNILGIEYCKALLRQRSRIQPLTTPRVGAEHDASETQDGFLSASAVRALLKAGRQAEALPRMTAAMRTVYEAESAAGRAPVFAQTCERALLARLRAMDEAAFAALDRGREGLYHRLYRASRTASSLEALLEAAKSRRYAHARLRRMLLWAYLGLTPSDVPERIPYLRPLAANRTGQKLLARMRREAAVPVLTKPADVRRLGAEAIRLFELEVRASDLYALAYPQLSAAAGGVEWREGPWMERSTQGALPQASKRRTI